MKLRRIDITDIMAKLQHDQVCIKTISHYSKAN